MARFLYAWELGGGYGHLAMIRDVAGALAARGHQVTVAMRDLSRLGDLLDGLDVSVRQAPIWLPEATGLPAALTHPELLLRYGFTLPDRLRPLVDAWRDLLVEHRIDAMVAEHAPTAVLAARAAEVPAALIGTGYTVPPALDPMPSAVPGLNIDGPRSESAHGVVREGINAVLAHYRRPPLPSVGALFATARTLLLTRAALDPYAEVRRDAVYLGARTLEVSTQAPPWPPGEGPCLVAYLKNDVAHLPPLFEALARSGARVLAHMPSTGPDIRRRLESERVRIVPEMLPLGALAREAGAALAIAGHGTVSTVLGAGVPMIALATQVEQLGTARRLAAQRIGLSVDLTGITAPRDRVPDFEHPLGVLLRDTRLRRRAAAFAETADDPVAESEMSMLTIVTTLEEMAG